MVPKVTVQNTIAYTFKIQPELLFNKDTAKAATKLPVRVDMNHK